MGLLKCLAILCLTWEIPRTDPKKAGTFFISTRKSQGVNVSTSH